MTWFHGPIWDRAAKRLDALTQPGAAAWVQRAVGGDAVLEQEINHLLVALRSASECGLDRRAIAEGLAAAVVTSATAAHQRSAVQPGPSRITTVDPGRRGEGWEIQPLPGSGPPGSLNGSEFGAGHGRWGANASVLPHTGRPGTVHVHLHSLVLGLATTVIGGAVTAIGASALAGGATVFGGLEAAAEALITTGIGLLILGILLILDGLMHDKDSGPTFDIPNEPGVIKEIWS